MAPDHPRCVLDGPDQVGVLDINRQDGLGLKDGPRGCIFHAKEK